ncbi:MAG: hypothetical protein P8X95_21445 [Anaerolineales bacterium]|jgi:hypothetical protein
MEDWKDGRQDGGRGVKGDKDGRNEGPAEGWEDGAKDGAVDGDGMEGLLPFVSIVCTPN